jgi:hypothetical protein
MILPGTHSRRAVCFLDILGFRGMLNEKSLTEIAELYDRIISQAIGLNRSFLINSGSPRLFPEMTEDEPYCICYIFSDSIILIARDDDPISCLKLLVHAWRLVQSTLAHRISVRGAVAYGDMYFDPAKSICLGHGLVNAYELEQKQNWVGVAIDKAIEEAYPSLFPPALNPSSIYESLFLRYPVPLKAGGFVHTRTLNWRWNLVVEHGTRWLFQHTEDIAGQEKIRNALAYAECVVKSGRVYAEDQGACPAELRAMWIGGLEPPFPHGDDL